MSKRLRLSRREVWIKLPGEYEGFEIKVWANAPAKLWQSIRGGEENQDEALAALSEIMLEHNGWEGFDGEPLPPPSDKEFWEAIPTELAAAIMIVANEEAMTLPNSLAPTKRR